MIFSIICDLKFGEGFNLFFLVYFKLLEKSLILYVGEVFRYGIKFVWGEGRVSNGFELVFVNFSRSIITKTY